MLYRILSCFTLTALICGVSAAPCFAVDYSEAVSGDLSNSGLAPTSLGILTIGANNVFGTTGRGSNGLDRDYFTFNVPIGYQWTSLTEIAGTGVGGNVSFLGLQAGNQVTVPTNAATAAGLLGWTHYGAISVDTDIMPDMAISSNGSAGFTTPLGAGNYSVWIQDFNAGQFSYGFRLGVQAVPEPGSFGLLVVLGLSSIGFLAHRRKSAHQAISPPYTAR